MKVSAGITGFQAELDETEFGMPVAVTQRWVDANGLVMEKLIAVRVQGDSMEDTLSDGDTVIINMFRMCGDGRSVFILNPDSPYSKYFVPGEVAHVLQEDNGGTPVARTIGAETTVRLGAPAEPPTVMLEKLSQLFARDDKVKAAYLATMHDPTHDPQPTLVLGIDTPESHMEQVARAVGPVIAQHGRPQEAVDMMRVEPGNGHSVADFMLTELKPFYERQRVGFFKSLFGRGR
ncbi:enhanced serine sensitivity protein SseB C-terminal domain-containing protein [Herbaspirillum sp. B65]|uniref:enhanced serine sensitivity protein SseB C-terminal domain-containing protein n=1 Tax=Herbaspirillum sp. B65 TaxID=137708 RepID=UPI0021108A38|nr:enhanced serine sensitivity protein SseB C-terminal domain-containing protein [Herbaspirillum sp. B65]